jgi:hypothetical protein
MTRGIEPMNRWCRQAFPIAANTFAGFVGDPLFLVVNLSILIGSMLLACLPGFTFGEILRLLRDEILALSFICGSLALTIGAANAVSDDIRRGCVPIVMSRPVSASAFIWGKWAGILAGVAVMTMSAMLAFFWVSRITYVPDFLEVLGLVAYPSVILLVLVAMALKHFLFRGKFLLPVNVLLPMSVACALLIINFFDYNGGIATSYGNLVDWKTWIAFLLLLAAFSVFCAIQVMFAVSFEQGMLMAMAVVVFFLGLFVEYFAGLVPVPVIRTAIEAFLPDWQIYWLSDSIADGIPVFPSYLFFCFSQAAGQTFLFLWIASIRFRSREYFGEM